jgi:hypothetical protein
VTPLAAGGAAAEQAETAAAMQAPGSGAPAADAPTPEAGRTEVRAAAGGPARFALTGRLVGTGGAPVPGVDLGFVPMGDSSLPRLRLDLDVDPEAAVKARSGTDGRFRVLLPAQQEQRLSLLDQPYYLKDSDLGDTLVVAGLTADRDLGDVTVGRAASVSGWVEDQSTGRRCPDVAVSTGGGMFPGPLRGPKSDAEGRFSIPNLRPGDYTLATASPDYLPARAKVTLAEGEARTDFVVRVRGPWRRAWTCRAPLPPRRRPPMLPAGSCSAAWTRQW